MGGGLCNICGKKTAGYRTHRCRKCYGLARRVPYKHCIDCKKRFSRRSVKAIRCRDCEHKRRRLLSKKQYCMDCGTPICIRAKRCVNCEWKRRIIRTNEYWKEYRKGYNKEYKQNIMKALRNYRATHKEEIKERRKLLRKNDSVQRLSRNIGTRIWFSLKEDKNRNHWENLVDFTLIDLKAHLEKQFKEGMSWDNYGEWHIDHIKPISNFNFRSYKDKSFKECWCLENVQPLWKKENLSKNKY